LDRSNNDTSYQEDELVFAQEEAIVFTSTELDRAEKTWKILLVDDDIEVHHVTNLALRDFTFEGRFLSSLSAYSAQEAKHLIKANPDIAIIFLDVVMETENAGLQVVKYTREDLNNQLVRIILRTGQPGRAPESVVVVDYGIDDYKTKTELTAQKLFISVITALRAFSTLLKISHNSDVGVTENREEQLQRFLQVLEQPRIRCTQQEKIAALGQLIVGVAREIDNSRERTDAFYPMSAIARLAKMVLRVTDEHFARLGISQTKLAVLIYLGSESELSASPSSLAKHCGVSRAAITGLLDGLEKEGYVERDEHPSDRRALMVKLTPKGQEFLGCTIPQDRYRIPELTTVLSEIEQLLSNAHPIL